jgi:hypothetical protein
VSEVVSAKRTKVSAYRGSGIFIEQG